MYHEHDLRDCRKHWPWILRHCAILGEWHLCRPWGHINTPQSIWATPRFLREIWIPVGWTPGNKCWWAAVHTTTKWLPLKSIGAFVAQLSQERGSSINFGGLPIQEGVPEGGWEVELMPIFFAFTGAQACWKLNALAWLWSDIVSIIDHFVNINNYYLRLCLVAW